MIKEENIRIYRQKFEHNKRPVIMSAFFHNLFLKFSGKYYMHTLYQKMFLHVFLFMGKSSDKNRLCQIVHVVFDRALDCKKTRQTSLMTQFNLR